MRLIRKFAQPIDDARSGVRGEPDGHSAESRGDPDYAPGVLATVADLSKTGRFPEALRRIDRELAEQPDHYDLLFARASVLFSWWRYAEAYAVLVRIEQSGSGSGAFYAKLGWTCFWLGRVDEAAKWLRQAVVRAPEDWETHFGRAIALRGLKRPAAAKTEFERVLALRPDDLHSISNLVACDVELGHIDRAERNARAALEREPQSSSATIDLGIVLCEQAHYADAVAAFERADALGFASADARDESVNYAICLLRAGRVRQAIAMMETKLRRHPSAALHSHYALALLTSGRMREGWDQYEFRWLQEPLLSWRPKFVKPVWAGQDLRGKTILLRAEQGYGDFIQFIRYAIDVKALGATVLLEVREELRELAETAPGIDRVLRSEESHPPFDYYINLLSIPRVLGTDLESIPAEVPYLHADPARVARWEDTIIRDGSLNVGIVWAGSSTHLGDRFRSLTLRALAPLRQINGVRFHSLQKGAAASELVTDRGYDPIVDLGPKLATFADTAAAVERLDLVISVDTSVVHLAGALAKPVWTLVAIPGDWRWLEEREDSPWYPTMRLFRQREPGDWSEVLGRLKLALEDEAERHRLRPVRSVPAGSVTSCTGVRKPVVHAVSEAPIDLCRVAETRTGIMMYMPNDTVAGRSIELYGEWMHKQLELLTRLLAPGMTVLEAGAGIGAHSVPLGAALGPEGHLFLYEDDGFLKELLQENLKANRITNATVMRRSLARAAPGDERDADTASPMRVAVVPDPAGPQFETIDDLRLERLDWLKISESADAACIVQGARETLGRLRPGLFVAVTDETALQRIAPVVRNCGYTCWRADAPLFNASNFNGQNVDVFAGRTSVVLLATPEGSPVELEGCESLT